MKAKFLKLAGVKTEEEFYKKFPTEDSFMAKYGKKLEKLKKAKVGDYISGPATQDFKPLSYSDVSDSVQASMTGVSAAEKKRQEAIEEATNNSMIYRAIQEYESQKAIIIAENKAEAEFKKKYGDKEWNKVLQLKTIVEKEHKENEAYYGHKLEDVRRVQFWCFFAAFIITTLLFLNGSRMS